MGAAALPATGPTHAARRPGPRSPAGTVGRGIAPSVCCRTVWPHASLAPWRRLRPWYVPSSRRRAWRRPAGTGAPPSSCLGCCAGPGGGCRRCRLSCRRSKGCCPTASPVLPRWRRSPPASVSLEVLVALRPIGEPFLANVSTPLGFLPRRPRGGGRGGAYFYFVRFNVLFIIDKLYNRRHAKTSSSDPQDVPKPTGNQPNVRGFVMRKAHWQRWGNAFWISVTASPTTFDCARATFSRNRSNI